MSTYVKRLDEQFVAQIRAGAAVTTMFTASKVRIGDRVCTRTGLWIASSDGTTDRRAA